MPHRYTHAPARLEGLRCAVTRWMLSSLLSLIQLASRLLPKGHPTRLFLAGRVPAIRETVLPATIPAGEKRSFVDSAIGPTHALLVLILFACVIGDFSASIPLDPFGLPDTHIYIGRLLGFHDDSRVGSAHIFSAVLPWRDGSLAGAALLVSAVAGVYYWRPRRLLV